MRRRNPVSWRTSAPFIACHFLPLIGLFTGFEAADLVLLVALYWIRMFFVTAGYHRYFAHKSFSTGRAMQFVFAFGGLDRSAEGAALVGGSPPDPSPLHGHGARPALALARVLVEPRGVDPLG